MEWPDKKCLGIVFKDVFTADLVQDIDLIVQWFGWTNGQPGRLERFRGICTHCNPGQTAGHLHKPENELEFQVKQESDSYNQMNRWPEWSLIYHTS